MNFDFNIRTRLVGSGLDDLERELQEATAAARRLADAGDTESAGYQAATARATELRQEIAGAAEQAESLNESVGSGAVESAEGIASIIRRYAALTAVLGGAGAALKAFANDQAATADLEINLAGRGLLSGDVAQQLRDQAGEIAQVVRESAAEVQGVFGTFLDADVDVSAINELTEATADLAALSGGDLSEAAALVTDAIEGETEALARYGIEVDEAATRSQRLQQILSGLANAEGLAEAKAATLSAQMAQLKENAGGFLSSLGGQINELINFDNFLDGLNRTLKDFGDALRLNEPAIDGLNNRLPTLARNSDELAEAQRRSKDAVDATTEALKEQEAAFAQQRGAASDDLARQERLIQANADRDREVARRDLEAGSPELQERLNQIDQIERGLLEVAQRAGEELAAAIPLEQARELVAEAENFREVASAAAEDASALTQAYDEAADRYREIFRLEQERARIQEENATLIAVLEGQGDGSVQLSVEGREQAEEAVRIIRELNEETAKLRKEAGDFLEGFGAETINELADATAAARDEAEGMAAAQQSHAEEAAKSVASLREQAAAIENATKSARELRDVENETARIRSERLQNTANDRAEQRRQRENRQQEARDEQANNRPELQPGGAEDAEVVALRQQLEQELNQLSERDANTETGQALARAIQALRDGTDPAELQQIAASLDGLADTFIGYFNNFSTIFDEKIAELEERLQTGLRLPAR